MHENGGHFITTLIQRLHEGEQLENLVPYGLSEILVLGIVLSVVVYHDVVHCNEFANSSLEI